ncbi:leucine-rich repeat extensin-like protein 3 [Zingiber officinale]|uniref:leucine-rich repeat extensin-like protein 3 n=1 Tax=Zingiber officinale TaxID=94328 RepID=UPI001C4CA921|nr:leucine-rich repeat extensin-like protein 3 [Zingiber officinale]
MRRSTCVPVPRCRAGRPRKRALESLATESLERFAGIEPVSQGHTPHGTAGASGSRIPTVLSPELPTPTVFTVPPTIPPETYLAPPPAVSATAYPTPPPPMPTAYPTSQPPVPATAYSVLVPEVPVTPPVPPPTVPPTPTAYINLVVQPVVPIPAYAATPGVPSPAYPAVPLVVPALVVSSIPAVIPAQPTDLIVARARISALAESVKSRFTVLRGEIDPSVA